MTLTSPLPDLHLNLDLSLTIKLLKKETFVLSFVVSCGITVQFSDFMKNPKSLIYCSCFLDFIQLS